MRTRRRLVEHPFGTIKAWMGHTHFAFFVALFVAIWFAAQALENADAPGGHASIGRILGTILLMYFAPIGVWVLRLKIRRVEAKTAA
jgi:type VI protein secretion system component VasK